MKWSHIIGLIIIAVGIGVIIITSNDFTQYATFEMAKERTGKTFHVVGQLELDEEMFYQPQKDPNYFTFYMRDNEEKISKVVYRDTKPVDFERSEQIVVKGKMVGEDFHAKEILMKCPSKYIEDEINLES